MSEFKYIVTHGGVAHQDELYTCALILAQHPEVGYIVRRNEVPIAVLSDKSIAVIDVGERFEPNFSNFDHHQDDPEVVDECALTLYMRYTLGAEAAEEAWVKLVAKQDTSGVKAAANSIKTSIPDYFAAKGPVMQFLLQEFSKAELLDVSSVLGQFLKSLGQHIIDEANFKKTRIAVLKTLPIRKTQRGHTFVDLRCVGQQETAYLRDAGINTDYLITTNLRGAGNNILASLDKAPKLVPGEHFSWVHKAGFIGTLREDVDPVEFLMKEL